MGEMRHLWAQNWDFYYSQNLLIRFIWICSWLLCPKWGNGVFLGSKLIFNFSQNEIIRLSLNCTKWKLLKKNFMAPFLWMGLNCLKVRVTSRRQFTFYHWVSRNLWYLFYRPQKDERLSQPWSHPVVLNTGPLDWESSALLLGHCSSG